MDTIVGPVALALLLIYVATSVFSALRMYFVHSRYVHLEFSGKKWRTLGEWAPKQYRRLSLMRSATLFFIAIWLLCAVIEILR